MPPAMRARTAATAAATGSPAMAAITAVTAPSVEAIDAMTPTLPVRTAVYSSNRPARLPVPARRDDAAVAPAGGDPLASTNGTTIASPTSMTQASVGPAPIWRLAREEHSMATVQQPAALNHRGRQSRQRG